MPSQFTSSARLLPCSYCGTNTKVKPSRVGERNFCCYECFTLYRRSKREQRQCANCFAPITRKPSRTTALRFCSTDCQKAYTRGSNHPRWQGGRTVSRSGYAFIKMLDGSYVQEHRLVMMRHLGRKLGDGEIIHHLNGDKLDNRLENLELTNQPEHARSHFALEAWSKKHACCAECGTTERRHYAHGLCSRCYRRQYTRKYRQLQR